MSVLSGRPEELHAGLVRERTEGEQTMEYKQRKFPLFSACGLNCGLCPRFHTAGSSKCPGCSGEGFSSKHPGCGVLSCCQRKGIEFCFECEEFPCIKYDGADESDSFISHFSQMKDLKKAESSGISEYIKELNEKVSVLENLLDNYNDGQRKSFFCIAVSLLELGDIRKIMVQAESAADPDQPAAERAAAVVRLFSEAAQNRGIPLKLRKKQHG